MLDSVIIVLERAARVVWGVDVDAFDPAGELLLQRLQREQVVAKDQAVIEKVVVREAVSRVVGLLRVFQEDTRLQLRSDLLSDPGQFELLFSRAVRHARVQRMVKRQAVWVRW